MTARHGGGYQYRLCPRSEPLTEACFQKTPLAFANQKTHTALFSDRQVTILTLILKLTLTLTLTLTLFSDCQVTILTLTLTLTLFPDHQVTIPATLVTDGPAAGWMRMPVPDTDQHPCDYKVAPGEHCRSAASAFCPGCSAPWYAADDACPTPCDVFPGLPHYTSADPTHFPNPLPGAEFHQYAIEDELAVPTHLPAGEYVLGWRWE